MKNCGSSFHLEVATRTFMEELRDLVKVTTNEKLKDKILELVQAWSHAFKKDPNYRVIQDYFTVMKAEGHKFPPLKETEAMFEADSAPQWADGDCCYRCRVQFNLMQRKHHCRNCGQIFCAKCSAKQAILPRFGIEKEVRVCDDCYEKLSKPQQTDPKTKISTSIGAAPRGSLTKTDTSNVTEPSKPAGKSEQELQEEEDLQMAIALSKSEAEVKEKARSSSFSHSSLYNEPVPRKERDTKSLSHEMDKYLDRDYWEAKMHDLNRSTSPAPSAPSNHYNTVSSPPAASKISSVPDDSKHLSISNQQENGDYTSEIDMFITNLKSALEIFVNRMNSNNLRGRPIANDTAVQSLFLNITNMHSQLLKHIQEQDDARVYYESLQDKLSQIRDARAALDALREEHREKMRLEAEETERLRQMQMAQKLEIMRKKKQEYLQYQRQMAIQRIQEQEREMLLRQEKQKYQWHHSAANQTQSGVASYASSPPVNYPPQVAHPVAQPPFNPYSNSVQMAAPITLAHTIPGSPSRVPYNQNNSVSIPPSYPAPYLDRIPQTMPTTHPGMMAPQPQLPLSQPEMGAPISYPGMRLPTSHSIITSGQNLIQQHNPHLQQQQQQQLPPPSLALQQQVQPVMPPNIQPSYEPKSDAGVNEQPLISFD